MLALTLATALLPLTALAAPAAVQRRDNYGSSSSSSGSLISAGPFTFTSTYEAYATPDQVVNANSTPTPGEAGAKGWFRYGINVKEEIICYNISVYISGNYSSPAKTATHIHQAAYGRNGPPRIAFPNPPLPDDLETPSWRQSIGCLKGPFTTGLAPNGTDTGTGFSLAQIEANPPGFFTDVHTADFPAGAVRGQLDLVQTSYN